MARREGPQVRAKPPETLAEFVEGTVAFELHRWQRDHLCPILDRLRHERGARILLHAPPQFGKSIVVSQRLPAYLLGHDPTHRIGLACYNQTHAANFGSVIRDLCASPEYAAMFPRSVIDARAASGEFSTAPREALRDGQKSFVALGLQSGFVGRGLDTLIVDDPYASAADAHSVAINKGVKIWWQQTARPRIFPQTNVVVMFHRYHDDDLSAEIAKSGGWEYFRFPAIADAHDDGIDPTREWREEGEALSPMRSVADLQKLEAEDAYTFAGQFQGRPRPDMGGFFQVQQIRVVDAPPVRVLRSCRAWDIAATEGAGDYTAGVRIDELEGGGYCIRDAVILQAGPDEVDAIIAQTSALDGRGVAIRLAQDPGSAGKRDAQRLVRSLRGFDVTSERVSGSKESRARAFAAQVNVGNVCIIVQRDRMVVTGPHSGKNVTDALIAMLRGFPGGTAKKDGVDASADAFNALTRPRQTLRLL